MNEIQRVMYVVEPTVRAWPSDLVPMFARHLAAYGNRKGSLRHSDAIFWAAARLDLIPHRCRVTLRLANGEAVETRVRVKWNGSHQPWLDCTDDAQITQEVQAGYQRWVQHQALGLHLIKTVAQ